MASRTKDENLTAVDRNLERVVFKLLEQDDTIDRATALKLIAKRALYKSTQRLMRPLVNVNNLTLE